MAKLRFVAVYIHKGPMTKIEKRFPEYELPVMQEKFGSLEVHNEYVADIASPESIESEIDRLRRHGEEEGTKETFFDAAYGRGKAGEREFANAYKAAYWFASDEPKELKDLTVAELKKLADEKGIEGYSTLKKAELIAALEGDEPEVADDDPPKEDGPEDEATAESDPLD